MESTQTISTENKSASKQFEKGHYCLALRKFIEQRPGLEFGNYGDYKSYQSELRSIRKDLHHARTLLNAVQWRGSISKEQILEACKHAYSGRLSIVERKGSLEIDYCVGQYWPCEYRRAVAAVCASLLWDYFRECVPSHIENKGDYLRRLAKKEFGLGIARRWFN